MEILVLGLNHKTAPLELREKMSIPQRKMVELFKTLEERKIFDERLVLSTCNRTEIYGVNGDFERSVRLTKELLSEYAQLELPTFEDKLYVLRQPQSIQHLFSVASGLDSMVLGETEIIGQVKDAYCFAHQNQQTGKILNTLFQRSFKVAKKLRSQTEIGVGKVSVASVAIDLAEKIFESLKNVRVMVIGTGEMAIQVAKAMISKNARSTIVSSYHFDRAQKIAAELGVEAVAFQDYETRITDTDVIIASTASPHALIQEKHVKDWMHRRRGRPLFLIDIAVPRNIEASIEKLDNVYLYNIDDLQTIVNKNKALRENHIEACSELIQNQTRHYMDWLTKEFHP